MDKIAETKLLEAARIFDPRINTVWEAAALLKAEAEELLALLLGPRSETTTGGV